MKHFKITAGEWPPVSGEPAQSITRNVVPTTAALLGRDAPQLRPKFEVAQGAHVEIGQIVFRDRKYPEIAYVAPLSGTISELSYGPRRTLSACVIKADASDPPTSVSITLDSTSNASVRQELMARGMWPAFRTRPFGQSPTPHASPSAIFVNATQSSPLAPDPRLVLAKQMAAFRHGVTVLTRLTDGTVFICQSKAETLFAPDDSVVTARFSGTIAAGLTGTHIDRLHPVRADRQIWSIGYQDVAAIGHLFLTGQFDAARVIAVTGANRNTPKLVQTCLGANIVDTCVGEDKTPASQKILSDDANTDQKTRFLGRYEQQVTLRPRTEPAPKTDAFHRLFSGRSPLVPNSALEHAVAADILPVPLMRALSVGDSEAALRLGCLALVEEDMAALSHRCTSGADYGVLLRKVLDELMETAT